MQQKLNNITSFVWSKKNTQKCTNISSKAFSHYQNDGAMRWMARWQEQEDGSMRNFSIIELAKDW
jgi:hypothetical protein